MKKFISSLTITSCFFLFNSLLQPSAGLAVYEKSKQPATEYFDTETSNYIFTNDWSYEGNTGPEYWGKINPNYASCSKGAKQSPVNIDLSKINKSTSSTMDLDITIQYRPSIVNTINTGFTIQANPTTKNNRLVLNGNEYTLQQFHFHTPSEHTINGQHGKMELHLVHQDKSGKIAVIGILIKEGTVHQTLNQIWNDLPKRKSKEAITSLRPLHLNQLLPKNQTFFYYEGSLTTPPCTEGVQWIVFKSPIEMSKSQIQTFQEIFPDNHRPTQPINDREILMKKLD
ncbi:carbonic anhydrase family protein [Niallia sp. XMNu-256]|uniref:carbonic anhydrase n=1 Tax=Niallia sp. XMNu-256 TaxID=3082444 RepID=UPI0030CB44A0